MFRFVLLLGIAILIVAPSAMARGTNTLSRREIRSMPITERPSRPGHFYGNAVRRSHHRSLERSYPAASHARGWNGGAATTMPGQVWDQGPVNSMIVTE